MFIRRVKPRPRSDGEHTFSFRLVRSERDGDQVRQRTLLNLGRHFDVDRGDWPALCQRIENLLTGQVSLAPECTGTLEATAQNLAAQLLRTDFTTLGPMRLYRASDALMAHREAIERHLFDRVADLFELRPTVTLYDLTHTYFEGGASRQPKTRRGHSKEKRRDCPLLTLALVLDSSGFVRRSRVFAGNVCAHRTLPEMLEAPPGAWVVMDRGIATEERIQAVCAPAQDTL